MFSLVYFEEGEKRNIDAQRQGASDHYGAKIIF